MMAEKEHSSVAVWLAFVEDLLSIYEQLESLLSSAEQARAARYVHVPARHEFVIGRACVRLLLADHLGISPHDVILREDRHGKPQTDGVQFNLSHSGGLIAIAVSSTLPVGIDIERDDRAVEVMDIAHAMFSKEDIAQLQNLTSEEQKRDLFFRLWTMEEARAKCDGAGLAQWQASRSHTRDGWVYPIDMPSGYHGTLCVTEKSVIASPEFLNKDAVVVLLRSR